MKRIEINGFKQIHKTTARKLYNEGKDIYMAPCKLIPGGPWGSAVHIGKNDNFDLIVEGFTALVCNFEVGYYPIYYIKEATK